VAATTPSSGTSATTWILIGVVVAALAVGLIAWTLVRRRRRLATDTRQYCSLHPEDALCGA
jgi:LPXTG-motif cell wall-anchored protein